MPCDVIIKLKSDSKTLTKKSYESEPISADFHDEIINKRIKAARQEFADVPKSVDVMIKLWE